MGPEMSWRIAVRVFLAGTIASAVYVTRTEAAPIPTRGRRATTITYAGDLGKSLTWQSAKDYCEENGQRLALAHEVCNGNSGTELFDGDMKTGDSWAPVADFDNEWIQVGANSRLCYTHSRKCEGVQKTGKYALPAWGTSTQARNHKGHVYCASDDHVTAPSDRYWTPWSNTTTYENKAGACKDSERSNWFPHTTHCKFNMGSPGSIGTEQRANNLCEALAQSSNAAAAWRFKLYGWNHHCALYFPAGVVCRDVRWSGGDGHSKPLIDAGVADTGGYKFYQEWRGGLGKKRTTLPIDDTMNDPNGWGGSCFYDTAHPSSDPLLSFEKCTILDPDNGEQQQGRVSFPMTTLFRMELEANKSDLVSPFVDGDSQLIGGSCSDVMERAGVNPPQPLGGSGYNWTEFKVVIEYQIQRLTEEAAPTNNWADEIMDLPMLFKQLAMNESAEAVRADFPTHWPTELILQLLDKDAVGGAATMDETVVPHLTAGEFVNKQVLLSRIAGWAVQTVSPTAFSCKHKYGRARPEELACKVQQGAVYAPETVRAALERLLSMVGTPLQPGDGGVGCAAFTAYEKHGGSPRHPSWPAMHSAASSASTYLPTVMDLTYLHVAETRKLDYAVAESRSVAGVHYPSDNIAGLMLGQQIVVDKLPGLLESLGFDSEYVTKARQKLESCKFSWADWKDLGCHLDSEPDGCRCPGCTDEALCFRS